MKNNIKMYTVFLVLLLGCVAVGWYVAQPKVHSYVYSAVCDLVNDKVYIQSSQKLNQWYQQCKQEAKEEWFLFSKEKFLEKLQSKLNQLDQSHLYLLKPSENIRRKTGAFTGNGMTARWIEDKLVVMQVVDGSVAAKLGVERGFEVSSLNAEAINNVETVSTVGGRYRFTNHKANPPQQVELEIRPQKLDEEVLPRIFQVSTKTAHLKVPSFYQAYFTNKKLIQMSDELSKYKNLILDLRGNIGGSLLQSVRLLSMITCKSKLVGAMYRPRETSNKKLLLEDEMNFIGQYMHLKTAKKMLIKTFAGYGCFKGQVFVLVDEHTGSSAEIIAQAIIDFKRGLVLGKPTAGEVLMAFEYELNELGQGHSLLIPEASYLTAKNSSLEEIGVQPDIFLPYILNKELQGKDSWVYQVEKQYTNNSLRK